MLLSLRSLLRLAPLFALCLSALCLFGPAASRCAAATTYFVSPTGNDTNPGTLAAPFLTIQHGINTAVSGDTVTAEDGTYTGPGNVDLDFGGRNITVTSQNGATKTIIDCAGIANANHRGFYLHSGETSAVISGFTIKNGYEGPNGGGGGGILNFNTGVTVQNCILTNNYASTGGGINNFESTYQNSSPHAAVTNCVFTGNSADDGGGIFNDTDDGGAITVTNCTVTGNTASDNVSGGVYQAGQAITMVNDIVYSNTGGSIMSYAGGTSSNYAHCDIQGGVPSGTIDNGGNIDAAPLFVNPSFNLHLQSSSPCLGAGTASGAPSTAIDGIIRPDPPSIGAYEEKSQTTTTLTSSLNPSVSGRSITFTATVSSGTGTVVFTIDGVAQPPISVAHYGGTFSMAFYTTSSLPVGSHTVTVTYSGDSNSAPSMSPMLTEIVNAHVNPQYVSPSGSDSNPGTQASPKLTIQAALNAVLSGDIVFITDGTYTGPGNVDLVLGGQNIAVVSVNGPSRTIIDCQGSSSANHRGFTLSSETNTFISGLTIENGYENNGDGGGGILNYSVGLIIQNCVFKNNAAYDGGGIFSYVYGNGTVTLINCAVTGNTALSAFGGGIENLSYNGGVFVMTNCTVTGNTANSSGYGGGLFNATDSSSTTVLTNDIFYGDLDGEVNNNFNHGSAATATYCDIQGGYAGTGNIDADPLFVNAPTDLHLQPGSPCLGAGTTTGAPTTTIDGYTRPNPPSIGAYEAAPVTLPAAPTNLQALAGNAQVTLTWTAPSAPVTSYTLYRGTSAASLAVLKSGITATTFTNVSLKNGTTYYYAVAAVNSAGTGPKSNIVSATPTGTTLPAAPTNLQAAAGNTQVTLTWTAPTGTVTSYTLYRGTSATSLTALKTGITTTTFTNVSLKNGTTYYYAVAAVNSAGTGAKSSTVSATPTATALPGAPTNLQVVVGNLQATLSWTAPTGTVTSYTLYRGTSASSLTVLKTGITATTFTNVSLKHATTYYYTVSAVNASGTGPASNEVSATP